MTNLEKYENEIKLYAYAMKSWTIVNEKITECAEVKCEECVFGEMDCIVKRKKWLQSEFKEPEIDWSKVAVDTPILVSDDEISWYRRYFAKHKDNCIYAWVDGSTSWSSTERTTSWAYAKLAEEAKDDP